MKRRKERLKQELQTLESGIDNSFTKVKRNTLKSLDVSQHIRNHPYKALGLAVLAGFAAGFSGRGKKDGKEGNDSKYSFRNLFVDELKRVAARHATDYISGLIDSRLKPSEDKNSENGNSGRTKPDG